jgi:hypothetical protein
VPHVARAYVIGARRPDAHDDPAGAQVVRREGRRPRRR